MDKEFVNGLVVKAPNEKAPDFIKCAISIKREELIGFLQSKSGDWINVDVKESKAGKWYAEVNSWVPNKAQQDQEDRGSKPAQFDDDIPFN